MHVTCPYAPALMHTHTQATHIHAYIGIAAGDSSGLQYWLGMLQLATHTFKLLACSPSSSIALKTALPPAEHTGFPPKVLKCSRCDIFFAISSVVTTAARGKPLPMPLAIVTMSGTTPWFSNPQNLVPVLPKPVCTSSAIQTPPAALTCCSQSVIISEKAT